MRPLRYLNGRTPSPVPAEARQGQMPTPSPMKTGTNIQDEDSGDIEEIRFTDIPMNRAMLAVREHFWETRGEDRKHEFMAMSICLMCFGDFVRLCMKQKDARIAPFVQMKDGELSGIDNALLEAAAMVRIGKKGFARKEMFAKARELAEKVRRAAATA